MEGSAPVSMSAFALVSALPCVTCPRSKLMAHRLRRFWPYVLVMASLALTPREGYSQQPDLPPPPTPPAPAFAEAAHDQASFKQGVDAFVESAFGRGSAETRRPVRLWISDVGVVVAAKEATLAKDGRSVRFVDVSLALPSESKVLRSEEATVAFDQPI